VIARSLDLVALGSSSIRAMQAISSICMMHANAVCQIMSFDHCNLTVGTVFEAAAETSLHCYFVECKLAMPSLVVHMLSLQDYKRTYRNVSWWHGTQVDGVLI
jgi:hypothetical protein